VVLTINYMLPYCVCDRGRKRLPAAAAVQTNNTCQQTHHSINVPPVGDSGRRAFKGCV